MGGWTMGADRGRPWLGRAGGSAVGHCTAGDPDSAAEGSAVTCRRPHARLYERAGGAGLPPGRASARDRRGCGRWRRRALVRMTAADSGEEHSPAWIRCPGGDVRWPGMRRGRRRSSGFPECWGTGGSIDSGARGAWERTGRCAIRLTVWLWCLPMSYRSSGLVLEANDGNGWVAITIGLESQGRRNGGSSGPLNRS